MSMMTARPKISKYCVFCNYWTGDAKMEFVSMGAGYKFDNSACGKCIKKGGSITRAGSSCPTYFEPNLEAKKLM